MSYERELAFEREQLRKIKQKIKDQLAEGEDQVKLTDDFTEQVINERVYQELVRLEKSYPRPYFAKVEFREKGQQLDEKGYVGRFGVYDKTTLEPLVLDWRSPMAHLYYDQRFNNVEIDTGRAGDILTFDVKLKRQFEMENDDITGMFDMTPSAGTNRLLVERLQQKGDPKLKDIVETIQAEQNEIIRADSHQVVVVQGVAGSGKTTIALHRLAYLAYQYKDRPSFDNFLIIAPNRVFIDYISEVLPELGVEGVKQSTWEDLIIELLPKKVRTHNHQKKITDFMEGTRGDDHWRQTVMRAGRIRGSMVLKEVLDRHIERRVARMIPESDLILDRNNFLTSAEIGKIFHEDLRHYPYMHRRKKLIEYLTRWKADREQETIRVWEAKLAPGKYAQIEAEIASVQKNYESALENYVSQLKGVEIVGFYRKAITREKNIASLLRDTEASGYYPNGSEVETVRDYLDSVLSKGVVEWEDLAPLFYLAHRFYGLGKFKKFSHIVVDEAQDLAPFQLYVLGLLSGNQSVTILGDLAQSIYAFKGLRNWGELEQGVFEAKVEKKILVQSYRSTIEIMNFANEVLKHWTESSLPLAKPVLRHGELPVIIECKNELDTVDRLLHMIQRLREEGFGNIALIDKTIEDCRSLHMHLEQKGLDARVMTDKESRYEGGLYVVPTHLSKGLEFDTVIIVNPTENKYSAREKTDIRLLYVGVTRALHRLYVVHWEQLTPLIPADYAPQA